MSTTAAHRVLATAELLAMIVSSLITPNSEGNGCAAKLAVVNQAFFHASISVIWEEMESFEPFCSILLPQNGTAQVCWDPYQS